MMRISQPIPMKILGNPSKLKVPCQQLNPSPCMNVQKIDGAQGPVSGLQSMPPFYSKVWGGDGLDQMAEGISL